MQEMVEERGKHPRMSNGTFGWVGIGIGGERALPFTETANKDGTWLREISSCCCLTTAGKTRELLLNKIYIPFLQSLYILRDPKNNDHRGDDKGNLA